MEKRLFNIIKRLFKLDAPPLIVKEETVRWLLDDLENFDSEEEFFNYYCDNKNFYKLVTSDLTMAILFVHNLYCFMIQKRYLFNDETVNILKELFSWIKNPQEYIVTNNDIIPEYIVIAGIKYKVILKLGLEKCKRLR